MNADLNIKWMNEAYSLAIKSYECDEIPIGAVVVQDNQIIGRGHNEVEKLNDATAHAEILAITSASNYNNDWRIFKDNLTWLKKTLSFIEKSDQDINWIIKEHPSEYGTKKAQTSTYKEFIKIVGVNKKNIKFFPKNFSTRILKDITNFVLTSQGSAGYEYPCFGIPSMICGDSFYRGFGITTEPKNEKEYYDK